MDYFSKHGHKTIYLFDKINSAIEPVDELLLHFTLGKVTTSLLTDQPNTNNDKGHRNN